MRNECLTLHYDRFMENTSGLSLAQRGLYIILQLKLYKTKEPTLREPISSISSDLCLSERELEELVKSISVPWFRIEIKEGFVEISDGNLKKLLARRKRERPNSKAEKTVEKKKSRSKRQISIRIDKMFMDLQKTYHPERAFIQAAQGKKAYKKLLDKASKGIDKKKDKGLALRAEQKYHDKIIRYIKKLSEEPIWSRSGGKYLQGIGKLLEAAPWEVEDLGDVRELTPREIQLKRFEEEERNSA